MRQNVCKAVAEAADWYHRQSVSGGLGRPRRDWCLTVQPVVLGVGRSIEMRSARSQVRLLHKLAVRIDVQSGTVRFMESHRQYADAQREVPYVIISDRFELAACHVSAAKSVTAAPRSPISETAY